MKMNLKRLWVGGNLVLVVCFFNVGVMHVLPAGKFAFLVIVGLIEAVFITRIVVKIGEVTPE